MPTPAPTLAARALGRVVCAVAKGLGDLTRRRGQAVAPTPAPAPTGAVVPRSRARAVVFRGGVYLFGVRR